jgi:hypothetical protein
VDIILLIGSLLVDLWLLAIVYRQRVGSQLPWFVTYVAWGVLLQITQIVARAVSLRLYIAVYWWMEAVAVILIVGAVSESFLRIFRGFTTMAWFRWSLWSVIGAVVAYSAWKAIHAPALQSNRLTVLVFDAEFLFRWGIAGIALLTTVLTLLHQGSLNTREDAVITGFGVASFTFVLYVSTFSIFGQKYTFIVKYLPSVGYFLAVGWWIWVFSRPEEEYGFEQLGMGPEDMRKEVRRYREHLEEVMKKKWRF